MTSGNKQIAGGAALSYVTIAFNIVAGMLYTPWMVRQIGQTRYGLYTLATSLIAMFVIDFGLSTATARFVSLYRAQGDSQRIDRFLGMIFQLYLILDAVLLLALVVVYIFSGTLYRTLTPEDLNQFRTVYLIAALYSVIHFPFVPLDGILTSHELFIQQKLASLLQNVLTVGLVVIALIRGMGLYALVTANALAGLAMIAFRLYVIRRHTKVRVRFTRLDRPMLKEILGFSAWVTLDALSARLIFNITPSILGLVASTSAIAVFGIVTVIEGHAYTITAAINGFFMPRISRIVLRGDEGGSLQSLLLRVGRFQFSVNGLIVAGFTVLGRDFIRLWMGESYLDAYTGVVLVLIPGLFLSAIQIGNTIVCVQNKVRVMALINFFTGILNVALSFFFSARLGAVGASLSIFTVYAVRTLALSRFYHRQLDVDMLEFARKCYLRLGPGVLGTIALGWLWMKAMPSRSWLWLGVNGLLVCAVYTAFLVAFGLSAEEKRAVARLLERRGRKTQ